MSQVVIEFPSLQGRVGGHYADKAGAAPADIKRLSAHRVHEGNRPSSLVMYPQTTARSLGGILALYEHSVFVQGTVWGINSFDQFGEFGVRRRLIAALELRHCQMVAVEQTRRRRPRSFRRDYTSLASTS